MPRQGPGNTRYDLLVVGGGIHGLFAAYDAAARGLSVTLVEKADFGSGLSFNHQRTLHGGLRAMQTGRVLKARRDVTERRTWARIAPHLLRPLPFLIATYRWSGRSRWALRAGFAVYDRIGRRRNNGISPELHLPRAKLESAAATRRLFPGVSPKGLTGGAVWYDYQTKHPDRLTWTVALAAKGAGATLINYVEAFAPLRSGGRIVGARVRDQLTGEERDIEATVTLLAAGSSLGALQAAFGTSGAPPLLRAMNALLGRPARDIAVAAPGTNGRMLTLVPWHGHVLVGTHQSDEPVAAGEVRPPAAAIEGLLNEANAAFRALQAKPGEIRLIHHGLVPATVKNGRADLLPEPRVIRHAASGAPGLISLVGTKYTTARAAAEHAIDAVCAELGRRAARSRTRTTTLPHAGIADVEGRLVETLRSLKLDLDRDVRDHLSGWYGTEASDVLRHAVSAGLVDRLSADVPLLSGEVAYAIEHADAMRLSDVVLRRTPLGSSGHPGPPAIERAAAIMAERLGWAAARQAEEIALVEAMYP